MKIGSVSIVVMVKDLETCEWGRGEVFITTDNGMQEGNVPTTCIHLSSDVAHMALENLHKLVKEREDEVELKEH